MIFYYTCLIPNEATTTDCGAPGEIIWGLWRQRSFIVIFLTLFLFLGLGGVGWGGGSGGVRWEANGLRGPDEPYAYRPKKMKLHKHHLQHEINLIQKH